MSSLTLDLSGLEKLIDSLESEELKQSLLTIPQKREIAALVGQAIADNFAQEGPGWAPLKSQTIRSSVSKELKKKLDKQGKVNGEPSRRILDRTGVLKGSVTTPGAQGNIYSVEGSNLIWGTDLIYAAIHNKGGVIQHPGTSNGFGEGIKIPPHQIPIKKREFLKIREEWMEKINDFAVQLTIQLLHQHIEGLK